MSVVVYLALGTNLGNRWANLAEARLSLPPAVQVTAASPVYETPPWGYLDQPAFLNQVVQAETDLDPEALLAYLKQIEAQMGRRPAVRYGPRLIDLDILFYGDEILSTPSLTIPHPRLAERAFVLAPLNDLAPGLRHPVTGQTIFELAQSSDRAGIHLFSPEREASMSEKAEIKPLNWQPDPQIGYTVARRPDGGMHYTFTDLSHATLEHWRTFAVEHLLSSDRLTRNLYDLRQVKDVNPEAVQYALELNSDPSARNIRLAAVVADEQVRRAVQQVAALSVPGGVEIGIFTDLAEAEKWLDRPLTLLV